MDEPVGREKLERIKNRPAPKFWSNLGISVLDVTPGGARLRLAYDAKNTNPYGIVAGGVLTALADTAVATALLTLVGDEIIVSVEHKFNFWRPAKDDVEAVARVLNKGRSLAVAQAELMDSQGRSLGLGLFTYAIRTARPEGAKTGGPK